MEKTDPLVSPPARRVGALGLVLGAGDFGVLMVEKARGTDAARWDLPGGAVGAEEDPELACGRRVREETGLTVRPGGLLTLHRVPSNGTAVEGYNLVFECGLMDESRAIELCPDPVAWRFVPPRELDALAAPYIVARVRHALVRRSRQTPGDRSAYLPG